MHVDVDENSCKSVGYESKFFRTCFAGRIYGRGNLLNANAKRQTLNAVTLVSCTAPK